MKALYQLNNVEKGKLLATLFPDDIPAILEFIKQRCNYLQTNALEIRKAWADTEFITADLWYNLASRANTILERMARKMAKRPGLFADQLFDGLSALYTIDCIARYVQVKPVSAALCHAVAMLFEYQPGTYDKVLDQYDQSNEAYQ